LRDGAGVAGKVMVKKEINTHEALLVMKSKQILSEK
jgi:hypothetical protein